MQRQEQEVRAVEQEQKLELEGAQRKAQRCEADSEQE